jgi:hypothetical protein
MKIFISHSSRNDPFAGLVREAVKLRLVGHEVLVDTDELLLTAGVEWRAVLYHWLAECHAAVVLLNREALESSWVKREVNILLWRRALRSPVRLVPAIIGDLRKRDIDRAGFGELTELQMARLRSAQQTLDTAELLAGQIADRLAEPPAWTADDSAMARWVDVLSFFLGHVGSKDRLVAAARELQVQDADLDRVRDPVEGLRFMAHQLLTRENGRDLYRAIAQIADYTPDDWLSRLIDKVGATWVDSEAARVLLRFTAGQPGSVVLLNARSPRTAEQYVDRATCYAKPGFEYETVTAVTGESFMEEFENECTKAVERLLAVESPSTIEDVLPPEDVLFLIVDPCSTRPELVAQGIRTVHGRFPWLVMVLLTGTTLPTPEELATWQLAGALMLEPALGMEEEPRAQQVIKALHKLRDKVAGRRMVGAA